MLTRRNILIAFFLLLAAVQIVRVDFFINHQYLDPVRYAHGTEVMPFQGRIAMVPIMFWAEHSHLMQTVAIRYTAMLQAGSPLLEPYTPDKIASLLTGILSLILTVAAASWYGAKKLPKTWWLAPALTLVVAAVTLCLRLEHNLWYPYDLPHLALFSFAVVCALQRRWVAMCVFYALDLPMRETSLFLLPIVLPLFWLNDDSQRTMLIQRRDWRAIAREARTRSTAVLAFALFAAWEAVHAAIQHHFHNNRNETGQRFSRNIHEALLPHHWPQLLSAGGFFALFVWLQRSRLPLPERLMLYGSALCIPAVLYFSIWNETRVWLEWTVPIAIAAAFELAGPRLVSYGEADRRALFEQRQRKANSNL